MTSPHYSREFVTKPPRRHARRACGAEGTGSAVCGGACPAAPQTGTGAKKKGASPQQYVDRLSGEPARRQVRRHRACEVERPLYDPGAKKEYRNEF
jgi:hypothetical protein